MRNKVKMKWVRSEMFCMCGIWFIVTELTFRIDWLTLLWSQILCNCNTQDPLKESYYAVFFHHLKLKTCKQGSHWKRRGARRYTILVASEASKWPPNDLQVTQLRNSRTPSCGTCLARSSWWRRRDWRTSCRWGRAALSGSRRWPRTPRRPCRTREPK